MSNKYNKTNQEQTETSEGGNKLTTVKTVYARCAIILLALNMLFSGYVMYRLSEPEAKESSATPPTEVAADKAATLDTETPSDSEDAAQQAGTVYNVKTTKD